MNTLIFESRNAEFKYFLNVLAKILLEWPRMFLDEEYICTIDFLVVKLLYILFLD